MVCPSGAVFGCLPCYLHHFRCPNLSCPRRLQVGIFACCWCVLWPPWLLFILGQVCEFVTWSLPGLVACGFGAFNSFFGGLFRRKRNATQSIYREKEKGKQQTHAASKNQNKNKNQKMSTTAPTCWDHFKLLKINHRRQERHQFQLRFQSHILVISNGHGDTFPIRSSQGQR